MLREIVANEARKPGKKKIASMIKDINREGDMVTRKSFLRYMGNEYGINPSDREDILTNLELELGGVNWIPPFKTIYLWSLYSNQFDKNQQTEIRKKLEKKKDIIKVRLGALGIGMQVDIIGEDSKKALKTVEKYLKDLKYIGRFSDSVRR
jgi:hypothetical protein